MHLLLSTSGTRDQGGPRMFFYDLHDVLRDAGVQVSLNRFDRPRFDVAIVHWARPEAIRTILNHSPQCRIGLLSPGNALKPEVRANTDFILANGFMWAEHLLKEERRIYYAFDYDPLDDRPRKIHRNGPGPLMIGYCGNPIHYSREFFPHGAAAVARLARERDLVFRVLTNGAAGMPAIPGVRMDFQEWKLETHEALRFEFDIGVCPSFANLPDLNRWTVQIRDSNRARSLLNHAIPSVISPVFQALQELRHEEHTLFAYAEDGWYWNLRRLAEDPGLRQAMGDRGRAHMRENFSRKAAATRFREILEQELSQPGQPKSPEKLLPVPSANPRSLAPRRDRRNPGARPWLVRHPSPAEALVLSTADGSGFALPGLALGSTSHCLAYGDPFDTRANPSFASPHPVLYVPPESGPTGWTETVRQLLEARVMAPGGLMRNPPRIATRVLLDTTHGNLLLGWLHRAFSCKTILMVQSPWEYVADRLAKGVEPLLPHLLHQAALVEGPLRPHLDVLRAAATPVAQHAASWCVQHLVPLREADPSRLLVRHRGAWIADPAAAYRELAGAAGWPASPKIAARLRLEPPPGGARRDAGQPGEILDMVRAFGLDREPRLFESLHPGPSPLSKTSNGANA